MVSVHFGKVAEWLKAPLSKSGRGVSSSGVQISPFPPTRASSSVERQSSARDALLRICRRVLNFRISNIFRKKENRPTKAEAVFVSGVITYD